MSVPEISPEMLGVDLAAQHAAREVSDSWCYVPEVSEALGDC